MGTPWETGPAVAAPKNAFRITLFGRLHVEYAGVSVEGCTGSRVQELLCYLLLHRHRPHPREGVASVLWGDQCTTRQSKTYLRKALWQLQAGLQAGSGPAADLIDADAEWLQVGPAAPLWLDVAALEEAYARVRDVPGAHLNAGEAAALQAAVDVYAGDLLEGWYQEWCLAERERLQQVYLLMLDKLMAYCERVGACEAGLAYGERSLRCDGARERTYRRLIRLHGALGDRTGALRVYERCVATVREELAAEPSAQTTALAEAVRRGIPFSAEEAVVEERPDVAARLERLAGLQRQLAGLQERVLEEIEALRRLLRRGDEER